MRWRADFLADAPPDPPGFDGGRARMNGNKARPTGVVADADAVYLTVMDQCRVVAFDAATGKKRWSYQAKGWVLSAAGLGGGAVLVSSQDKHVHCLDAATGEKRWAFQTGWRVEATAAVDGADVFAPSCDGRLYRLDLRTGERVWAFELPRLDKHRQAVYSTPVVAKGRVYFAAEDGSVYAVTRAGGKQAWAVPAAADSECYSSPATDGQRLFVSTRPRDPQGGGPGVHAVVAVRQR